MFRQTSLDRFIFLSKSMFFFSYIKSSKLNILSISFLKSLKYASDCQYPSKYKIFDLVFINFSFVFLDLSKKLNGLILSRIFVKKKRVVYFLFI